MGFVQNSNEYCVKGTKRSHSKLPTKESTEKAIGKEEDTIPHEPFHFDPSTADAPTFQPSELGNVPESDSGALILQIKGSASRASTNDLLNNCYNELHVKDGMSNKE